MQDPRFKKLSEVLVRYSTKVKKGDKVFIDVSSVPDAFVVSLVREVQKAGGIPLVEVRHPVISRVVLSGMTEAQAKFVVQHELSRMKQVQAYIAVRGTDNMYEHADVPKDKMEMYSKILRPLTDYRVNHTRWVVLRWPNSSMAQASGMSTEAFEDFYFNVCTMNYHKMGREMAKLQKRMRRANRVRLEGPGDTDLRFSIKGIAAIPCAGELNIPDGEVFTAPVKESVEGVIHFNAPTSYNGTRFENIRLVFKKGKIVEASGSNQEKLNAILNTDAGARYVGEFAIGVNPYILEPMGDILFDEKIAGSIHFTPGQAYEIADNGNRSAVHWDMVLIQRKEYGGGEIWFDDELIRKNGLFVPKDLQGLNPKNLLKA